MSKEGAFLNPLQRDGTSQNQRLLEALLPENNPIDERSLEDLLDYLQKYAELLLYYDVNNFPAGNWQEFIELGTPDKAPEHPPHMALLLSFLNLFSYLQEHINTLTAKHLDFYYHETLQLLRKKEQPDQVHLVFELAKQIDQHRLKKDTSFKAGKDTSDKNRFYGNDDELVINHAMLSEEHGLKTVFIAKTDTGDIRGIHKAAYANSSDGAGAAIEEEDGKWETFGSHTMPHANIGFAVASPMLYLAEGTRTISIRFNLESLQTHNNNNVLEDAIKDNMTVLLSGEKEWMPFSLMNVVITDKPDENEQSDTPDEAVPSQPGGGKPPRLTKPNHHFPLDRIEKQKTKRDPFSFTHFAAKSTVKALTHHASAGISRRMVGEFPPLAMTSPVATDRQDSRSGEDANPYLEFQIVLSPEDKSVVAYDDSLLGDGLASTHPVAKFLLAPPKDDKDKDINLAYEYLNKIKIESLDIRVDVQGVKNLILENDLGVLNPAKPFHPFGPIPKKGSKFYIGSNEVFQKALQSIDLHVSWGDLPDDNFDTHYAEYTSTPTIEGNDYFKTSLKQLHKGGWELLKTPENLFHSDSESGKLLNTAGFAVKHSNELKRPKNITPVSQYHTGLQYGFIRMELLTSFLHNLYPTVLAQAIKSNGNVPNVPYTPLITELKLNYNAREIVDYKLLEAENFTQRVEQLFHIAPFGQVEFFPVAKTTSTTKKFIDQRLLPDFPLSPPEKAESQVSPATEHATAEGSLYIGIDKLTPPQNLSILFQVAEGSASPEPKPPKVYWSYMVNNRWKAFNEAEILSDKTNGLLTSGIIHFAIPKEISNDNTLLPNKLHWIKASVKNNTESVSKLIAVIPQAVTASFRNEQNDLSHLGVALPAETISKLKQRDPKIKSVRQPFASFDGQLPERDTAFYQRVSERLRHKGRAITIFDYERLILEQFPAIYKVKCINHTQNGNEFSPGYVRLIVVPYLRNKNAVDPLRPNAMVNTLREIERYISRFTSDFVTVEASNPQYEQIEVAVNVAFHEGYDQGFYLKQLDQDIIKFLSPWLYDDAADIAFGGRIHRTWILNHIEKQEYVDFVSDFQMNHIVGSQPEVTKMNVEEAIVHSSSSVLVSCAKHIIDHTNHPTCEDKLFGGHDEE